MNNPPTDQPSFYLCGTDRWQWSKDSVRTYFAPPGRSSLEEFCQERSRVLSVLGLQSAIDAMPNCIAILNEHRQLVLANCSIMKLLDAKDQDVLGYRLGEALGCAHWKEAPEGCGTGHYCTTCGAVAAIWESQQTHGQSRHECRFTFESSDRNRLDLCVTATALRVEDSEFVICVVDNIAEQKRLEVLSRTFFHDLLNTVAGIRGYADYVAEADVIAAEEKQCLGRLHFLSALLLEEISAHRDLSYAESGELKPQWGTVRTASILEDVRLLYDKHPAGDGCKVVLSKVWDGEIESDACLLRRVIGNMIKNALEATAEGGVVTVGCDACGDQMLFHVHNASVMSAKVQLQVFTRSFSTKGEQGRGIGTYSMKLLGERYLGGRVSFTSHEASGTTFTLSIPCRQTVRPGASPENT
jgi:signal transduction histidine kinase